MRQRQPPDKRFVDGIADINISNPLAQAHAVCQILDAGVTANGTLNIKDALNTVLNANPNIPVDDAGSFIGMVIGTYRPQYKPLVKPTTWAPLQKKHSGNGCSWTQSRRSASTFASQSTRRIQICCGG